jgi:hypothetical protein
MSPPPSGTASGVWIQAMLLVAVASAISLVVGSALGFAAAGNRHPSSAAPISPQEYARVRTANIGPLEQALSGIWQDCFGNDRGQCTLSIAYALALTQKFQDELLIAPSCSASSDAKLRSALTELDASLHAAAIDNALGRGPLSGMSDLTASDMLFRSETCANAMSPSSILLSPY